MRTVRDTTPGLRLIIAVVCTLLLVMPGLVIAAALDNATPAAGVPAGTGPDVTSIPTPPVPSVFLATDNTTGTALNVTPLPTTAGPQVLIYTESVTGAVNPPPLLIFDPPVVNGLTSTLHGIVYPGSVNVTIIGVRWDWGDDRSPEYHGFPNSHVYSSPGTYTFSITALQSDGQNVIGTSKVSVGQPLIPSTVPVTQNTPVPGEPADPSR